MTVIEFHRRTFTVTQGGCWEDANRPQTSGYVQVRVAGRKVLVHRWAYSLTHGAMPAGLTIDHLCRNRRCANPEHLEAVTLLENIRRSPRCTKTECLRGHPLAGENLRKRKDGRRDCRTCYTEAKRAKRSRERAA